VAVLFCFNRWVTLAWAVVCLLESHLGNPEYGSSLLQTSSSCISLSHLSKALDIILFATWAVFTWLRTYAVCCGSWQLPLVAVLLSLVPVGTNAVGSALLHCALAFDFISQYAAESDGLLDVPYIGTWCSTFTSPDKTDTYLTLATRICCMLADLLVLVITWRKTYTTYRTASRNNIKTPLTTLLLRDGTVYFM